MFGESSGLISTGVRTAVTTAVTTEVGTWETTGVTTGVKTGFSTEITTEITTELTAEYATTFTTTLEIATTQLNTPELTTPQNTVPSTTLTTTISTPTTQDLVVSTKNTLKNTTFSSEKFPSSTPSPITRDGQTTVQESFPTSIQSRKMSTMEIAATNTREITTTTDLQTTSFGNFETTRQTEKTESMLPRVPEIELTTEIIKTGGGTIDDERVDERTSGVSTTKQATFNFGLGFTQITSEISSEITSVLDETYGPGDTTESKRVLEPAFWTTSILVSNSNFFQEFTTLKYEIPDSTTEIGKTPNSTIINSTHPKPTTPTSSSPLSSNSLSTTQEFSTPNPPLKSRFLHSEKSLIFPKRESIFSPLFRQHSLSP